MGAARYIGITFTVFGKWHFAFALMPIVFTTQLPFGGGFLSNLNSWFERVFCKEETFKD
jgi:hypothetical protein